MMPLGLLSTGETAEVMEIRQHGAKSCECRQACPEKKCCRVEDIGLRIGKIVRMLTNEGAGPLLLKVDESRIALGRGLAMKIMVERQ